MGGAALSLRAASKRVTRMPGGGHRTRAGLLVATISILPPAASAWGQQADRPLPLPKSDVTITYRLDKVPWAGLHKLQFTYSKAGERVRVDYFRWVEAKFPYLTRIFDRAADRLITVYPERKAYIERPIGDDGNPGAFFWKDTIFSRQGNSVIANAQCTEWGIEVPGKGEVGDSACVTDDGITLQLASANPSLATMTATAIHYGSAPDGSFDPPAGFHRESTP